MPGPPPVARHIQSRHRAARLVKLTRFAGVPYNGCGSRSINAWGWPSGWASAFQADLHGFDSRTPLQGLAILSAGVAQLVEHLICNQRVGGSSPSAGSKLPVWPFSQAAPLSTTRLSTTRLSTTMMGAG